ncbi:MAG: YmdB family metallophosphoesterase [Treponema sp.]|nr:YmdB family metallophosphoesterase [Treponema sp.]
MKILYVAEIVGKAGVYALKKCLPDIIREKSPDFVIACADGATGGNGLGRNHAAYIRKLGVQALTTGECCFYKKDLTENLGKIPYVLRPDNFNAEAPGIGSRVFHTGGGAKAKQKVAVAVLLGQSGFGRTHGNNPFSGLPALLERLRQETPYVVIDFHALATAEKQTFFAMADGGCSAVIGSHTRVQTSDERILPGGTAVITDAGRTGSAESVGGCDRESRIKEYLSGIPDWTKETWERPVLQGLFVEIAGDGKARSVERLCAAAPEAAGGDDADSEPAPDTPA